MPAWCKPEKKFNKKKILVKFFGKFSLVGQLGLATVDLWATWGVIGYPIVLLSHVFQICKGSIK